jgi:outer membrane protein assembly factor BamB
MWKRRLAIDAVVVVAVVAIAFVVLTHVVPLDQFKGPNPLGGGQAQFGNMDGRGQPRPQKAWKPSTDYDAEANADFSVEESRKEHAPAAGKPAGADWPQFEGLHRDNHSTERGLLARWPDEGPALAWVSHGLGAGFSSVAVVDGVVYTMGNKGASEAMIALDAGTGEKKWATPFAWASHPSMGDGPRSTPTVSRDKVYALGANADLACLETGTGKIRWQKNIDDEFNSTPPGWGVCESVLVDEDRVICTPGGIEATMVALHPETGDLIWKSLTSGHDHAGYASAIVVETGGLRQYVQFTAEGTIGVRADDGRFLWRDNSASNTSANCSSPLTTGEFVFSASNYGVGGSLVRLEVNAANVTSHLVYHTGDMTSHHGGMVIADGLLYGSSGAGVLTCLDLATGKPKWRNRSVGKGSITYAEGKIYLRSEEGPVALVEATGSGYRELGRFTQPHRSKTPTWSYPVVAEGKLFLRDGDVLLCYDLRAAK